MFDSFIFSKVLFTLKVPIMLCFGLWLIICWSRCKSTWLFWICGMQNWVSRYFFVQNYFDRIKGHVEETHDNFVVCKNDHILSSDGQLAILNICNLYFKNQIKCNQKSKWFGFRLFSLSISIVDLRELNFLAWKETWTKLSSSWLIQEGNIQLVLPRYQRCHQN